MSTEDILFSTDGVTKDELDPTTQPAELGSDEETCWDTSKQMAHEVSLSCFYFDIETIPDFSREDQFGLPQIPEIMPRYSYDKLEPPESVANGAIALVAAFLNEWNPDDKWIQQLEGCERRGKDRAGVYDAIKSWRSSYSKLSGAKDERMKLLSTTPEFCKIIGLGWAVGDNEICSMVDGTDEDTERDILKTFWDFVAVHSPLVGFNIIGFDLPVIFWRTAFHGIQAPVYIDRAPFGKQCIDLMLQRFGNRIPGGLQPSRLKDIAKHAGIDPPAKDTSGGDVLRLYQENKNEIHRYVQSDIFVTRAYHQKFRGLFFR